MSWSLKGFWETLRTVDVKAVEFHNRRGDFESWAQQSLQDKALAHQVKEVRTKKLKGEVLRKAIIDAVEKRFKELSAQVQAAVRFF